MVHLMLIFYMSIGYNIEAESNLSRHLCTLLIQTESEIQMNFFLFILKSSTYRTDTTEKNTF